MKFLIVSFSIMVLTSVSGIAQDVSFGLKGGVNIATAAHKDMESESTTSFHIGGMMEALYTDKIALQTEIIYSEQGFMFTENGVDHSLKLSYINVPVMLKYYVWQELFLEAGPQIGFLNSAKLKTKTNDDTSTSDVKDGLRSNDLSFNIGVGFQLNNGLNFNARYCYGLTNIVNRLADEKFKNRVLQFSVGYFF